MNLKSIYDIIGLKFQDKFFDVVLCENPKLQYKVAKEILISHKESAEFRDAELSIITADRNNIYTILRFIGTQNLENFRGMTIRNLYVDKDIKDLSEAKIYVYPCAKRIIEKA